MAFTPRRLQRSIAHSTRHTHPTHHVARPHRHPCRRRRAPRRPRAHAEHSHCETRVGDWRSAVIALRITRSRGYARYLRAGDVGMLPLGASRVRTRTKRLDDVEPRDSYVVALSSFHWLGCRRNNNDADLAPHTRRTARRRRSASTSTRRTSSCFGCVAASREVAGRKDDSHHACPPADQFAPCSNCWAR